MTKLNSYEPGRHFLGRFPEGSDLVGAIEGFARENDIRLAVVELIGAVTEANLGFFDKKLGKYKEVRLNQQLEIVSGLGNISTRNGEVALHLHLALGDEEGRAYGGHALPGTKVFVAEVSIQELKGDPLVREYNPETGLALWKMASDT